jgi:hypothetical protein
MNMYGIDVVEEGGERVVHYTAVVATVMQKETRSFPVQRALGVFGMSGSCLTARRKPDRP